MDSQLKDEIISKIGASKVQHTLGCIKEARKLAEHYGANVLDAEYAMLFHDVTKHFSKEEQFTFCEKYGIMIDDVERETYKLLHAKTASEFARQEYGMNDDICRAIRYHTTLRRDMTLIEKIAYLADYIEENRSFDGVEIARKTAYTDIDETLRYCLDTAIKEVMEKGNLLHYNTIEARNYLYEIKKQST